MLAFFWNWRLTLIAIFSAVSFAVSVAANADDKTPAKIRIVLVGDSTVTAEHGWGGAFATLLGPDAECINMASAGKSSKSYRDGGRWKKVLAAKGDYMLIQFGHNDEPHRGPKHTTDPQTTFRENMARYVDEARAAGFKPILVTSMTRRHFNEQGKIESKLTPYVEATKAVAAEKKVPLVDLHAASIGLFNKMGRDEATAFAPKSKDPKDPDLTHLNEKGAAAMAPLIAGELVKAEPALAKYLKSATEKKE